MGVPNALEPSLLPTDLAAADAMILAKRVARLVSEVAVERLKLEVARLRREHFETSSGRSARVDQLELVLEDLEETLAETDAQAAAEPDALPGAASSRRKPARRPLPEHLPRERILQLSPTTCACYGGARPRPLGEDVTEALERIPTRWLVIQHVRERFSCRDCETIA
jgi:transposase